MPLANNPTIEATREWGSPTKLVKRPRRTFGVQEQAQSDCERICGMSESDLKLIVGELVGAAKSLKETHEKQEKSQAEFAAKIEAAHKNFDARLTTIEDLVKNGKFLRLIARIIGYPVAAIVFSNIRYIWEFLKKTL